MELTLRDMILSWGAQSWLATAGAWTLTILALILGTFIVGFVLKHLVFRLVRLGISRTNTRWDDFLFDEKFFKRLGYFIETLTGLALFQFFVPAESVIFGWLQKIIFSVTYLTAFGVLNTLLTNFETGFSKLHGSRRVPVKSYIQVVKILLVLITGVMVVSAVLAIEPWGILSGIGALTAVILFVFKDAILGFMASVQLNSNDIVKIGDRIEIPSQGIDGEVVDINLSVIKIKNADLTVTTLPTYTLVSGSFKNWSPVTVAGSRRARRSLLLDVSCIKFLDPGLFKRLSKIYLLKDYLTQKEHVLREENQKRGVQDEDDPNGRRLTNIGTFRAYALAYLAHHPDVHPEFDKAVRQLESTGRGLPLELVFFSRDPSAAALDKLQGDIFDHLMAILPVFDLRLFQEPTGHDSRAR